MPGPAPEGLNNSEETLATHLHWAQVDEIVFLLDALRGEYFGLDQHMSGLWTRLAGGARPNEKTDETGFADLLRAARAMGWLIGPDQELKGGPRRPRGAGKRRNPTPVSAYVCLVRAFLSLRYLGFARTYARVQSMALRNWEPNERELEVSKLDRAVTAFSSAEHFIISRLRPQDCLPRSFALFVFLCEAGISAHHCIGVRRYPFAAHAWVQHGSDVILESPA